MNPASDPQLRTLADALSELVGQPLSSVEFVQDYVQLHFDGPTLTAYTPPTVSFESAVTLAWEDAGYRDSLCKQIGSVVHRSEVQSEREGVPHFRKRRRNRDFNPG
jgi:hypothetical protein